MMRIFTSVFAFSLAVPTLVLPESAFAVCAGHSILDEIATQRPEVWAKALADFDAQPNSAGLFWKIEKEDAPPSWLLGTMHVADPDITSFRPAVAAALDRADTLVLELTGLSGSGKFALAAKMAPLAMLPEGETVDADFSKEQKEALGGMTAAVGMPYFSARRMKPWFLVMNLSMPVCEQAAMLRGEYTVDAKLEHLATQAGKRVVGLETVEEQLAVIGSLENALGPTDLLQLIALGPDRIADLFATDIQVYRDERPTLSMTLMANTPEYARNAEAFRVMQGPLIHDRNLRMHERLLPILAQGNAFIGVGALHLPGDDGLVELLRASGYKVTRVQ